MRNAPGGACLFQEAVDDLSLCLCLGQPQRHELYELLAAILYKKQPNKKR